MRTKEQAKAYRQAHRAEHREHVRKYAEAHKDKVREYIKRYKARPSVKAHIKAYKRKWFRDHYIPHPRPRLKFLTGEEQTLKRKARVKAQYARNKGTLKKQRCVFCGNQRSQMHHPDYAKPLEVIWLCRSHHLYIHRNG